MTITQARKLVGAALRSGQIKRSDATLLHNTITRIGSVYGGSARLANYVNSVLGVQK